MTEHYHRHNLAILCFHRVLPPADKSAYFLPDLAVTPTALREYCRVLSKHFQVLPLAEAMKQWPHRKRYTRPLLVLTFDDGYQDNYEYAANILEEFGLRATFFVIAGLVGSRQPPWYDLLGRVLSDDTNRKRLTNKLNGQSTNNVLEEGLQNGAAKAGVRRAVAWAKLLSPESRRSLMKSIREDDRLHAPGAEKDLIMTDRQIQELIQAGHEIGSHTMTHELLTQLKPDQLRHEVRESRNKLEEVTGVKLSSFCYPNGDVNDEVRQHVQAAGYQYAVTTRSGLNRPGHDPLMLQRYFVHEKRLSGPGGNASGTLMRMEISQLADLLFARARRNNRYSKASLTT